MKELDLSSLYKIVKERIIIILLSGVILAGLVFGYNAFFVSPTYRTKTSILVTTGDLADLGVQSSINNSDLTAALTIVETCVDILKSDYMYEELANALGNKYSPKTLQSAFVPVARGERSLFIDIYTYGEDPEEIKEIANTFLAVAPTFIKNNILSLEAKEMDKATSSTKVAPRTLVNTLIAFAAGILASTLLFVVISLFKTTIESEDDFKNRYDVPLLGTVPIFENKQTKGRIK